eukprot:7176654-Alexandrium_andersonii.AAC.1
MEQRTLWHMWRLATRGVATCSNGPRNAFEARFEASTPHDAKGAVLKGEDCPYDCKHATVPGSDAKSVGR